MIVWIIIYTLSIFLETYLSLLKKDILGLILPIIIGIVSLFYVNAPTYYLLLTISFLFFFIKVNKIIYKKFTKNDKDLDKKSIIEDL